GWLLVDGRNAAADVSVAKPDRPVLERPAEPLLAFPQRLLGPPEVGDVGASPEPLDDVAAGVADRRPAGLEPTIAAVSPADPVFHVVGAAPRHRIGPEFPGRLAVVGVQGIHPAPVEQFVLRDAGVLGPLRAEVVAGAIRLGGPYQLRQCFGQVTPAVLALAEGLLALPQRLFIPLALEHRRRLVGADAQEQTVFFAGKGRPL